MDETLPTILIGSMDSGVEVRLLERDSESRDLHIYAQVSHEGFKGEVTAWISEEDFAEFLGQPAKLDQFRTGSAALQSMSPGELLITVRSLDKLGHVGIEGTFVRYYYGVGARQPQTMSLSFGLIEFDPTTLSGVVKRLTLLGKLTA